MSISTSRTSAARLARGIAPRLRHHSSTWTPSGIQPDVNPLQPPQSPTPPPGHTSEPTTHFGFRQVPESLKETLVGSVFSNVSPKYDLMNDGMSLGIHRIWKDAFVSSMLPRLPPSIHDVGLSGVDVKDWKPNFNALDVAGGTGDIALRILDRAREKYGNRDVRVEIVDLNEGMLHEGRKRVAKTMYYNTPQITFTHGNAQSLPLHIPSSSQDMYTIAFGIRNCTSLPEVLKEAYRVLKPGGKLGVLEFGKVGNPLLKQVYKQYSFNIIPMMGQLLAGDRDSYQYLVESIEKFPSQAEFAQLVKEAGFKSGEIREGKGGAWTDFSYGICSAWYGIKA